MDGRGKGSARAKTLSTTAVAACTLAVVAAAAIPAGGATRKSAAPKLTLAKARADVAAARRPLATFTGPTTSPGPVPKGKSIVSIYSVPAALPQRSARGVVNAAQAIG